MGFYRLALACVVVCGHLGVTVAGYNPGVIAVVSFFLLSGFVMTGLIDRHYSQPGRIGLYYIDRTLRLFPQFLFYSLLTLVAAQFFGLRHPWMQALPSALSDLAQMTMMPLDFAMFFPNMLLPQAWSLGLECFFYLVFPFLLAGDKRMAFAVGSATIFVMVYLGHLPAEWFSFRLLPGVLFIFLLGSFIRRPGPGAKAAPLPIAFALAAAGVAASLWLRPAPARTVEVLLGLLVGLPAVWILARCRISNRLDALAGDLSYGVFLNHNLLIAGFAALAPWASHGELLAAALPASAALSYASFRLIEAPVLLLRHRLRANVPATALAAVNV